MKVKLKDHLRLSNAVQALRNCYQSSNEIRGNYQEPTDDINKVDIKFLDRIINQLHHETGAEFITYVFEINDVSIGLLGQISRHRVGVSFLVRSTRYCAPTKYIKSGDSEVDEFVEETMDKYSKLSKKSKDKTKYLLPQATSTDIFMSINMRALMHMFKLRTTSKAHPEIKQLMDCIFEVVPQEHKYLFEGYMKNE